MQDAIAWVGANHRRTMVLCRLKNRRDEQAGQSVENWLCRLHDAGSLGAAMGYGESADAAARAAMGEIEADKK